MQGAVAAVPRIPSIALGLLAAASLTLSPLQGKRVCSLLDGSWALSKVLQQADAVAVASRQFTHQAASFAGHAVEQVSTEGLDTETKRAGNQGANALIEGSDITDESVESVGCHSPNTLAVMSFHLQLVRHHTQLSRPKGKVADVR